MSNETSMQNYMGSGCECGNCEECAYYNSQQTIDYWIDVKHAQPFNSGNGLSIKVIVFTKNKCMFIDRYDYELGRWCINIYGDTVTHWILLPNKPSNECECDLKFCKVCEKRNHKEYVNNITQGGYE